MRCWGSRRGGWGTRTCDELRRYDFGRCKSGETYTDGTAARASRMRRRDDDWPLGWGHAWIVDGHARVMRERADRTQALGIPRSSPARFTREARSGAARRVRSACTTTVRRLKLGARSGHPVGIRCSTVISVVWDVETVDSVFECEVRCRYWIGTVFGTRACSKSEQAEAKREAVCERARSPREDEM